MPQHLGTMTVVLKDLPEVRRLIEERTEMLDEISSWVIKKSAPNQSYRYSRCIVCDCTWWDDREIHNFDCWVPRLQGITVRKAGDF